MVRGKKSIANVIPVITPKEYIEDDFPKATPRLIHVLPASREDIACMDGVGQSALRFLEHQKAWDEDGNLSMCRLSQRYIS